MRAKEGWYHSRVLGLTLEVMNEEWKFTDSEGRVSPGPEELAQQEAQQREEAKRRAAEAERLMPALQARLERLERHG